MMLLLVVFSNELIPNTLSQYFPTIVTIFVPNPHFFPNNQNTASESRYLMLYLSEFLLPHVVALSHK